MAGVTGDASPDDEPGPARLTPPPVGAEAAPAIASVADVLAELEPELRVRSLDGFARRLVTAVAIGLSLYAIYWVLAVVEAHTYRVSFLLIALVLVFLLYPSRRAARRGVTVVDWALIVAAIAALGWPLLDDAFVYRAATPTILDLALGTVAI